MLCRPPPHRAQAWGGAGTLPFGEPPRGCDVLLGEKLCSPPCFSNNPVSSAVCKNTFEAVLMFSAVGRREASELGRRGQVRRLAVRLKRLKESPLRR